MKNLLNLIKAISNFKDAIDDGEIPHDCRPGRCDCPFSDLFQAHQDAMQVTVRATRDHKPAPQPISTIAAGEIRKVKLTEDGKFMTTRPTQTGAQVPYGWCDVNKGWEIIETE